MSQRRKVCSGCRRPESQIHAQNCSGVVEYVYEEVDALATLRGQDKGEK